MEKRWPLLSQTSKHTYSVITKCVQETPMLLTGKLGVLPWAGRSGKAVPGAGVGVDAPLPSLITRTDIY